MQRFNVKDAIAQGLIASVVGGGLALLVGFNPALPAWAPALPAALGLAWFGLRMRRSLRRLRAGDEPSAAVRSCLEEQVHFYQRLDEAERARFRREVHWFLLDQHIEGVNVEVTDELRALVAASAVVLSFGLPWYEWEATRDILLYPSAYDETYNQGKGGTRLGQVSRQGPVILSVPALKAGFAKGNDGHNVGFHEFAHVLDFDDGEIDGVPAHLSWPSNRPWVDQMAAHFARRKGGQRRREQVLRDYAFTNEAEFFACATEVFFEQPALLARRAPQLYDLLSEFYGRAPSPEEAR